jgi:hypothetical protein
VKPKTQQSVASTERMVDYDRNSYMQDQMVRSRAQWLRAAVERIGRVVPEFTAMDYGCGPGHSALDAVAPVIEAYRRIDPRGAMVIRHSDQMGNDWNALFALVFGPDGYQRTGSGIRTEAVAGSFYTQLAAPGSLALLARNGVVRRSGRRGACGICGARPGRLDAIPALPRRGIAAGRDGHRVDARQRFR